MHEFTLGPITVVLIVSVVSGIVARYNHSRTQIVSAFLIAGLGYHLFMGGSEEAVVSLIATLFGTSIGVLGCISGSLKPHDALIVAAASAWLGTRETIPGYALCLAVTGCGALATHVVQRGWKNSLLDFQVAFYRLRAIGRLMQCSSPARMTQAETAQPISIGMLIAVSVLAVGVLAYL